MGPPPFDASHCASSNGGEFILLQPLDAELFDETSRDTVLQNADSLTFRQISRHPVVIEG